MEGGTETRLNILLDDMAPIRHLSFENHTFVRLGSFPPLAITFTHSQTRHQPPRCHESQRQPDV